MPTPNRDARRRPASGGGPGRAQLTLVEHALCPLDTAAGLREGLVHRSEFYYLDAGRHQRKASARVVCPFGLSPGDEFYLWGLIALTLSQPNPSIEFYATPHYCLSELSAADGPPVRGGKTYALFRQSVTRLAAVTYLNDRFYDPVRGEHRDVAFGFLSYSLPADPASSRAWRFVWDPIFFEFCQAARGSLLFDLETYRALDFAGRRLFLLLKKIFWRSPQSPLFDVRHLGVNVLGFAPSVGVRDLKVKLARSVERLVSSGIVEAPGGVKGLFEKRGVGAYTVRFRRGPYFDKAPVDRAVSRAAASPLSGPLRAIGFDDAAVARILAKYAPQVVQVWADITLAAKERAPGFFKVGPEAYFLDNVEHASQGVRTPPDWWHDHRKEEQRREREAKRLVLELPDDPTATPADDCAFEDYLAGEGRSAFEELFARLTSQYRASGHSDEETKRSATETARAQLRDRFRPPGPTSLAEILKRFKLP